MEFEGRQVDVRQVIESLGFDIRGDSGRELLLDCFWHDDRGRNLSINLEAGLFHCWVCSVENYASKGNLLQFVSRTRGITLTAAKEYIVEHSAEMTAAQLMKDVKRAFGRKRSRKWEEIDISGYVNPYHPYWRHKRGIDYFTAKRFLLGFDEERDHATIPITVEGKPVAILRRTMYEHGKRYILPKAFPKEEVIFGLDRCEGNGLYICEGAIDALKVHKAGYNGIAILGDYLSVKQAKLIRQYSPEYIVIMTDEDLGGQILANQIGRVLSDLPLYYTILPNGKKDPGSCTTMEIWEAINLKKGVLTSWLEQAENKSLPLDLRRQALPD